MLLKKIFFVNSFLLLFSFQTFSQDTTTIMNFYLNEASLWGDEDWSMKESAEYGYEGIKITGGNPIEKATHSAIIFYKDAPVSHQGAIIGNIQNTFINKVLEPKFDSLLKKEEEPINHYQLTQNWTYNKKSNRLEIVTESFNPIFSGKSRFDPETFEEDISFIDTKSNIPFKQNSNMKPEEVVNRIVIAATVYLSEDITIQLLSSNHVFNNGQHTYYANYDTKQFDINKNVEKDTIPLYSIDTTIVFDPETFEEQKKVVEWRAHPNDFSFYIVYELLFDAKNQITTNILGLRPYQYVFDDVGTFKYDVVHRNLFTVYTEEIFPYMKQGDLYRMGFKKR